MGRKRLEELAKDPELVELLTPVEQSALELILSRNAHQTPNPQNRGLGVKSRPKDEADTEELMAELKSILTKDPSVRNRISPMHKLALDYLLKEGQTGGEFIQVKRKHWEMLIEMNYKLVDMISKTKVTKTR